MSHTADLPPQESEARAAELRDLAGPVNGDAGTSDADGHDETVPSDEPDALSNPEVDEVRSETQDDDVPEVVEDSYELRSMGTQPNPIEDDPGSHLNL